MALDWSALLDCLTHYTNADAADRIKQAAETIYQALIDAELTAAIGAGPHERTDTRINQRNGTRPRTILRHEPTHEGQPRRADAGSCLRFSLPWIQSSSGIALDRNGTRAHIVIGIPDHVSGLLPGDQVKIVDPPKGDFVVQVVVGISMAMMVEVSPLYTSPQIGEPMFMTTWSLPSFVVMPSL